MTVKSGAGASSGLLDRVHHSEEFERQYRLAGLPKEHLASLLPTALIPSKKEAHAVREVIFTSHGDEHAGEVPAGTKLHVGDYHTIPFELGRTVAPRKPEIVSAVAHYHFGNTRFSVAYLSHPKPTHRK